MPRSQRLWLATCRPPRPSRCASPMNWRRGVARRQHRIDVGDAARVPAHCRRRSNGWPRPRSETFSRAGGLRIVLGTGDQLGRAADAHEMGHVKFTVGRAAADHAGELETVGMGQDARHSRTGARIVPQLHDRGSRAGIADRVIAGGGFGDGVGILAVAERGAGFLHGAEPGLPDKLKQSARGRRRSGCLRIEVGFHLRGGEQILEAGAGGVGGLLDRAGNTRARRIDTRRCRGA